MFAGVILLFAPAFSSEAHSRGILADGARSGRIGFRFLSASLFA
ncbi:hypothetical protein K788_0003419 [Paraburkholderia caribensis MBA4]|uniref:Uncharacterized protein n=1 Tax=Paraburkholderia caribensis MBA4 TaxID=1323664 RepID=A0A0P0RCA6_9BURK|nr:hypothetical protein K788_0003419 [Paraburkholderia caribensis MBA4]